MLKTDILCFFLPYVVIILPSDFTGFHSRMNFPSQILPRFYRAKYLVMWSMKPVHTINLFSCIIQYSSILDITPVGDDK